nr:hypothetical protein [Tanacetum cinerariifolium]
MIDILEKSEHNVNFHSIVDFVEASPLRRKLKLQDKEGISTIVPLFDTVLVPQGEGSGTLTEPYHTPSPEAHPTSHTTYSSPTPPPVTIASIPTVTPSEATPIRQYTRRARIAQSSALPLVADKPASPLIDVSKGKACPTDSGFGADQDRANITKTSTLPHDSAPRVTSLAADEGKDREGLAVERSGDDAPIKGRNLDEGEASAERVSDDTEEMATVLTSMDAISVLASGVAKVPTGSGSIPTASPLAAEVPTGSDVVPTAGLIFVTATVVTPYTRRKGKETMVESKTPKKKKIQEKMDIQMARQLAEEMERDAQRMNEQIARDAEIARINAEEELQIMIDGLDRSNEIVAKYLQEYHHFATELPFERRIELLSDLVRGMKFEEFEAKFTTLWKQLEDFVPMGSKEEAKRLKRKGLSLEQESMKKLMTLEEVPKEAKSPDEVPEEKVYTEGHRSYWKITRLGGSSVSYQFFIDMLKHLDREDLNQLWALVKESLSNRKPTSDKQMELWVELKRLYEPDDEDQLWTHTQNLMHALVEWKLYDTCGVHHVTAKDKEIFMLIEKDYQLRKGLAIRIISYKLQVENYSKMANDLILKIYKIASSPRQQSSCITIPLALGVVVVVIIVDVVLTSLTFGEVLAARTLFRKPKIHNFFYSIHCPNKNKVSISQVVGDNDPFEAQEVEITMLKARVKLLEDAERGGAERFGDDASIKGRRLDEGEEAAKKGSNDTKEMINVLTSMDAATVLSSRVAEVPTGSGSIPT